MVGKSTELIKIDLNQFKLHIYLKPKVELTLHFSSPSRRFYLSVIGLVVCEMQKRGKIVSIPLQNHLEVLKLLNETVGGSAGSSRKEHLLNRIYLKWKDALPDLENAPLFKVVGRKKGYTEELDGGYGFSEGEQDSWANLFEYKGSHENVRLRFSFDRLGARLDDVVIVFGEHPVPTNLDAWERFVASLKADRRDESGFEHAHGDFEAPEPQPSKPMSWVSAIPGRRKLAALMIGLILGVAGLVVLKANLFAPQVEVASVENMAFPLPDKPSIAVLPFRNMSDDPKQDYFSDGLTEEIITGLSKVPGLFAIARNSTFTYKGKDVKVQQVSEELGVRYVLEGSVRKADNRLRITAQLIDAIKGHHLWAGRYDRELKDIFAIQDEITIKILTALRVQLTDGETARLLEQSTDNLQAYLKVLEGRGYLYELKFGEAVRSFTEARTLDPQCVSAYSYEAAAHVQNFWFGPNSTRAQSLEKAFEAGKKCEALDDDPARCSIIMGVIYLSRREYDKAIFEGQRAVEAFPNSADAATFLGWILRTVGRHEESLRELKRALRLNPKMPAFPLVQLCATYLAMGRNDEAIAKCNKVIEISSNNYTAYLALAIAYCSEGRMDEARAAASKVMKLNPNFSAKHYVKNLPYKDEVYKAVLLNDMLKAGLN